MDKFTKISLLIILITISTCFVLTRADDNDKDDDYDWDFVEVVDGKPKLSKQDIISLTRDWLARDNPDTHPTHGFFPVWAFALLIISAFFLALALVSGLLYVVGCRGKRPVERINRADNNNKRRESLTKSRDSLRKNSLHSRN